MYQQCRDVCAPVCGWCMRLCSDTHMWMVYIYDTHVQRWNGCAFIYTFAYIHKSIGVHNFAHMYAHNTPRHMHISTHAHSLSHIQSPHTYPRARVSHSQYHPSPILNIINNQHNQFNVAPYPWGWSCRGVRLQRMPSASTAPPPLSRVRGGDRILCLWLSTSIPGIDMSEWVSEWVSASECACLWLCAHPVKLIHHPISITKFSKSSHLIHWIRYWIHP